MFYFTTSSRVIGWEDRLRKTYTVLYYTGCCWFSVAVTRSSWSTSLLYASASAGDRLWTGKPHRRGTRHPALLSLTLPSVAGLNEYMAKAGKVKRPIAWYISPYPWSHSVCWLPSWVDWLAEISADLREVVAH